MKLAAKLLKKVSEANIKQFIKYGVTGGLAFLLEYSTFYVLNSILGLWYIWSNSLAMTFGFALSFTLNRYWSFKSTSNVIKQLFMYGALFLINLGISNLLMMLFIDILSIKPMISKIIAICILICWNYIIYKKIIFK